MTLPSWKEQLLGSWVHRLRYLHQWQRKVLFTQDRHLQDEINTLPHTVHWAWKMLIAPCNQLLCIYSVCNLLKMKPSSLKAGLIRDDSFLLNLSCQSGFMERSDVNSLYADSMNDLEPRSTGEEIFKCQWHVYPCYINIMQCIYQRYTVQCQCYMCSNLSFSFHQLIIVSLVSFLIFDWNGNIFEVARAILDYNKLGNESDKWIFDGMNCATSFGSDSVDYCQRSVVD